LNWRELGFTKAMHCLRDFEHYLASLPKRMAPDLLQNDQDIIPFLSDELEVVGTKISQLQESHGALPPERVSELLSPAASAVNRGFVLSWFPDKGGGGGLIDLISAHLLLRSSQPSNPKFQYMWLVFYVARDSFGYGG
jgi:hypothetical protein